MQAIRRLLIVVLLAPFAAGRGEAQTWYSAVWQPGIPLSNTKDFADDFAWRGIGLDAKKIVKPNVALGLSLGWQVFTQQTDEVVSAFGVDISGDQFRYINSFPILANISYVFGQQGRARPYVSANVGTYIIEQRLDIGLYSIHETNWHFGFGPEAGIAIPLQSDLAGLVNARYNYALSAGNVDEQSYVSFGVGLAWTHGP